MLTTTREEAEQQQQEEDIVVALDNTHKKALPKHDYRTDPEQWG
jgi:hypothetical protein